MSTEFYPLTVSQVDQLTNDAVAVCFDVPENLKSQFKYTQGQHLTLKAKVNGEETRRSYSICESVDSQKLMVAIKSIDQGIFSNWANTALQAGMLIDVLPPQGHFYTDLSSKNTKQYLCVAVGSGITPILSNIESILQCEAKSKVTLVFGNKTSQDVMLKEKLGFIKNRYIERFHWINVLTREPQETELLNGRLTVEKIKELDKKHIINLAKIDDILLCGPEELITNLTGAFSQMGIKRESIHYELFFSGVAASKANESRAKRVKEFGEKTSKVSVKVAGRVTYIELPIGGPSILDAALAQGVDLPFSCKGGVCATCKAKIINGKVDMDSHHALTEQEIKEGMILTCQAHPVSQEVVVDFDLI